jgi:hypothetical protein
VWQVTPAGTLGILVEPTMNPKRFGFYEERLRERMRQMPEANGGGLPCLKGEGPAISAEDACRHYRERHPDATWEEVFANVPNHYASAKSMQSAFYSNRQRRAFRERMKRRRNEDRAVSPVDETSVDEHDNVVSVTP